MNCFEARKEFAPFWRHTIGGAEREAFLDHLRQCRRCDHSFRVFALTAPVLYSDSEPERGSNPTVGRKVVRINRFPSERGPSAPRETSVSTRPWRAACAAMAMLFVAGLSVYAASTSGPQTIDQTLTGSGSAVELASYSPTTMLLGREAVAHDQVYSSASLFEASSVQSVNGFAE